MKTTNRNYISIPGGGYSLRAYLSAILGKLYEMGVIPKLNPLFPISDTSFTASCCYGHSDLYEIFETKLRSDFIKRGQLGKFSFWLFLEPD